LHNSKKSWIFKKKHRQNRCWKSNCIKRKRSSHHKWKARKYSNCILFKEI